MPKYNLVTVKTYTDRIFHAKLLIRPTHNNIKDTENKRKPEGKKEFLFFQKMNLHVLCTVVYFSETSSLFRFGEEEVKLCTEFSIKEVNLYPNKIGFLQLKIFKIYIRRISSTVVAAVVFITNNICRLLLSCCCWWWCCVFASILGEVYRFWYIGRCGTSN